MKVDVYRNLRKPGVVFSIRQKGKVVGYAGEVILEQVQMKQPNPAALERMRRPKRPGTKDGHREVCCWLKGFIRDFTPEGSWRRLACDPKKVDWFCDAETGRKVETADWVLLNDKGAFYR